MKSEEKSTNKEKQTLIIRKYHQYLKLEKALSPNTVDAYQTDLQKLLHFLEGEGIAILDTTLDDLQHFASGLHDIGIHPRSQARILSGIKSFFHFLVMADYLEGDPSELLEGPKIGFKLPEVLTVEEIDRIISAIDLGTNEGQRNRAILETLYSCGLRVSELCNLKISDLYFDEGFIKVEGKGSKQRLVPISSRAIKEIRNWFVDRNEGWNSRTMYSWHAGAKISRASWYSISSRNWRRRPASPKTSALTPSAIPLPPTCLKEAPTYAPYKVCWATNLSLQQKFTHILTGTDCAVKS